MLCRMSDVINVLNNNNGLYKERFSIQQGVFLELKKHEMFYEISLEKLDKAIVGAMIDVLVKNELDLDIAKQLEKLADHFLKNSRGIDGDKQICGMRGRMRAANLSEKIANRGKGPYNDFYAIIGNSCDCSEYVSKGQDLCKKLKENNAFPNDTVQRPGQFAVDGMLLPSRVEIINDPIGFLKECLSECSIIAYNNRYGSEAGIIENSEDLREEILEKICKKDLIVQSDTFKHIGDLLETTNGESTYASKPNLASAMKGANLRTICSASGTTINIIVALCGISDKKRIQEILSQVKSFVDEGCPEQNSLSEDFKRLFLSISVYMQSGQYHSAAEVLCSLYSAAQMLCDKPNPIVNIENYKQLFGAFAKNPSSFFPKSLEKSDGK